MERSERVALGPFSVPTSTPVDSVAHRTTFRSHGGRPAGNSRRQTTADPFAHAEIAIVAPIINVNGLSRVALRQIGPDDGSFRIATLADARLGPRVVAAAVLSVTRRYCALSTWQRECRRKETRSPPTTKCGRTSCDSITFRYGPVSSAVRPSSNSVPIRGPGSVDGGLQPASFRL